MAQTQKIQNQKSKPEEQDTKELLESLRKDLLTVLLETEGLIAFAAKKNKTRSDPKRLDKNNVFLIQTPRHAALRP